MIRMAILFIFWAFSLQPEANSQALRYGHTCKTDYWHTVTCFLKLPVTSTGNENTSYWLEFSDEFKLNTACPLQRAHEVHSCFLKSGKNGHIFMSIQIVSITLYYTLENRHHILYQLDYFKPAQNIKPTIPYTLTMQYANGTYIFIWKNGYEDHKYKEALPFIYNFMFYKDGHNGSDQKYTIHSEKEMKIDEMYLDPDSKYTAMVRTGIQENEVYSGTWSEWSGAIKWKTRHSDESSQTGKIVVGICLILGLLLLLLSVPAARMKIKEIVWVPTPETYFQPLYTHYQGNFQGWVLAKSPLQDVHVIEEFSTIDKIAEAKTILQDQGEKSDMYPQAQYHTSYVGPTNELWVPCQTSAACSETSIPCGEFSLFCEALPDKVDIIQRLTTVCLSEDGLSLKGSVLSHKSLESLENCGPTEVPVIIIPTPACFKQDYCTLTDTLTGPVPTFNRDVKLNGDMSND